MFMDLQLYIVTLLPTFTYFPSCSPLSLSPVLENYIDGAVFLTLTEADIKAMIPPLGLVKKIIGLQPNKEKEVHM